MTYQIENKSDLTGAMLVIRFPEEDLDKKALYTIQADQPAFLVPFRYRCVDGEAECTYQLGSRVKLLYHCSSKSPGELTGFWEKLLQPLLDCGDWFLKPFSFVLDIQYLYIGRDGGTVSYIYVPSKRDCGDMETLREMAAALAEKNPSTDANLEVKVLRAIMQDFQPRSFLQLLRKNQPAVLAKSLVSPQAPAAAPSPEARQRPQLAAAPEAVPEEPKQPEPDSGDIVIDLSGKKPPKKSGLFGGKEEKKKEKKPKKQKKEGGLFGKKKAAAEEKEIILGAAADRTPKPGVSYSPVPSASTEVSAVTGDCVTEDCVTTMDDTFFRLVGDQRLPREIPVALNPGELFTIGRFDVTVGRRQSSFEFDSKTKAISRHHAAVERRADGSYTVTDLDSTAGTFVDGVRLTPNVPHPLAQGSRVSFGTAGADYIWEESDWREGL